MLRVAERLPEAIALDDIPSFEDEADRIEFLLTREASKQHNRQAERRPSRPMGPIQHHSARRQSRQDVGLDMFLPVWTVGVDEQNPLTSPTNPPEPHERV